MKNKVIDAIKLANQLNFRESALDYPGGSLNVEEQGRINVRAMSSEGDLLATTSFGEGGGGPQAKECSGLQRLQRIRERMLLCSLKKKHNFTDIIFLFSTDILILASVTCVRLLTSRNIINLCCFNTPSLW